jgi:hypothetical protein
MSESELKRPGFLMFNNWAPPDHGFRNFTNQPTYPLPIRTDANFAREILYHRLSVSTAFGGDPSYSYLPGSGIAQYDRDPILTPSDIGNFMDDLQSGPPELTRELYNMANDAPHIVVKRPCYVVIELHVGMGLKFVRNGDAIATQDDFRSGAYAGKYQNLNHYDVEWHTPTPTSSPTLDTFLIYFGVRNVRYADENINDRFNLCLQQGDDPERTIVLIDPAIKNRGPR